MRHSLSKGTAFNGETTPRHIFLCSDSKCLPPGDPRILCAKHGSPITGKSFIKRNYVHLSVENLAYQGWNVDSPREGSGVGGTINNSINVTGKLVEK